MEWNGDERRRDSREIEDLAQEVRALSKTVVEMHRENIGQAEIRRDRLDARLSEMAEAVQGLALAVQRGDSTLSQDLAVHIATAHHAGTVERLGEHENRLNEHQAAIGKLKAKIGVEDHQRENADRERNWRYLRWGLIVAALGALWQGVTQLVSGLLSQIMGRGGS